MTVKSKRASMPVPNENLTLVVGASKQPENIILTISGGIGKNILATALAKEIKKKYPASNLIVMTAWKEVWLYNPLVYRTYVFDNHQFFYEDMIKDKEVKIFALEPYQHEDYVLKRRHLLDIWCELCGVENTGESPELYFNAREIEYVRNNITLGHPIFLVQTHGGSSPEIKHSWMRDLPIQTAIEVINKIGSQFRVLHVRRDDQPIIEGVEQFKGTLRELFVTIRESTLRLYIDSACQHAAAALGKSSVVCWIRNDANVLGWPLHQNVRSIAQDEIKTLDWSGLEAYNIAGFVHQCPFKEGTKIFDTEQIIDALKKTLDSNES
jgi:hypothetical protein